MTPAPTAGEDESLHGSRRLIDEDELVRLDAQVGVCVSRVRLADDDTLNNFIIMKTPARDSGVYT